MSTGFGARALVSEILNRATIREDHMHRWSLVKLGFIAASNYTDLFDL